ncbi:MAG: kelch repeat-containing protein [Candidatus Binatus sp.]
MAFAFTVPPAALAQYGKSNWGQILIAGGRERNTDEDTIDNSVDLYDPASNRFAPEIATTQMKERMRATATLLDTGPNAGKVLIAGGDNRNGVQRTSTELYDLATNAVADGPAMKSPRSGHTATVIPSGPNAGKILFAGGMGADGGELASTELYDPATNKFFPGPTMRAGCSVCTATVIMSGKNAGNILIAGSDDSRSQKALLELYDSPVNEFILGPRTNIRGVYSATAIASGKNAGKVLILGRNRYYRSGSHRSNGPLRSGSQHFCARSVGEKYPRTPHGDSDYLRTGCRENSDRRRRELARSSLAGFDRALRSRQQRFFARAVDEHGPRRTHRDGHYFGKKYGQDSNRRWREQRWRKPRSYAFFH